MSFNDLERGSSPPNSSANNTPLPLYRHQNPLSSSSQPVDPEFERLSKRIGIQIFKIQSNVTAIQKLVSLLANPPSNSSAKPAAQNDFTKRIHDLTETTRELIKDGTADIKALSTFPLPASDPRSRSSPAKLTQAKLQRDFQAVALSFQRAQRESVQRTREALERERQRDKEQRRLSAARQQSTNNAALVDEQEADGSPLVELDSSAANAGQQQAQQLELLQGPSQADLEFQESLIASREAEIREIESGVQELNEIFRDLGNIVQEQGGMIDNIEFNITNIAENTDGADRELVVAHEYQRKAGRRAACLLLIVGFVIAIVLLAILS
ncbi:SNAP receptor [Thecaphora frezii]